MLNHNKNINKSDNESLNSDLPLHEIRENRSVHCFECGQYFRNFSRFCAHAREQHEYKQQDDKVSCPDCGKMFKNFAYLCIHARKYHADSEHLRNYNKNKMEQLVNELPLHEVLPDQSVNCLECSKLKHFKNFSRFCSHARKYHNHKPQDEIAASNSVLPMHSVLADRSVTCLECDENFRTFIIFCSHAIFVHDSKVQTQSFECPDCGKTLKNYKHLTVHMNSYHPYPPDNSETDLQQSKREFKCVHCNKSFISKHNLKTHVLKVHHPEKALKRKSSNELSDDEESAQTSAKERKVDEECSEVR